MLGNGISHYLDRRYLTNKTWGFGQYASLRTGW